MDIYPDGFLIQTPAGTSFLSPSYFNVQHDPFIHIEKTTMEEGDILISSACKTGRLLCYSTLQPRIFWKIWLPNITKNLTCFTHYRCDLWVWTKMWLNSLKQQSKLEIQTKFELRIPQNHSKQPFWDHIDEFEFWYFSHNAIFDWNFQKYSVKILYDIIDWVYLGIPK